jgi:hypothetical protein
MATLKRERDGRRQLLVQDSLIGRSPDAVIRLESPRASSRHANLSWGLRGWELRDLGSRNGTSAGGARVPAGRPSLLEQGQRLVFGVDQETWILECDAPPTPAARRLGDGELVQLEDGYLSLPSADDPQVSAYEHPSLGWLIEDEDGELKGVHHEQVLSVCGQPWKLHLVEAQSTLAVSDPGTLMGSACLRFIVSADEENVDVELVWPEDMLELPPSVHWYIPLLLARARAADRDAGELPPRERGWVYRDDLCKQLRTTPQKLNVDIHRLRRLLSKARVSDGSSLVERRAATAQIRLGVARFQIT